jgi:peptidyl-prolyl cis-trans isomerase-like protein 2
MCTTEGHVFEMLHIIPFIKKYGKNPVTGEPLKISDLIAMNWSKNDKG